MIKTILVIDDEDLFRSGLKKVLELEGYAVVGARDGQQGLMCYREMKPDLILTDIVMPEKEGIETIMEIIADNPNQPVIAMSGGGLTHNADYLEYAKEFGARKILKKPFKFEELFEAIRELS